MRLREHLHRQYPWADGWLDDLFVPAAVLARLSAADRKLVEAMHELLRTEIVRQLDGRRTSAAARRDAFLLASATGGLRQPRALGTRHHEPADHDVARARALVLYRRDDELAELASLFLGQDTLSGHMNPEIVRETSPVESLWQSCDNAIAV